MTASEYDKKYVRSTGRAVLNFILIASAIVVPYQVIYGLDLTGDWWNNFLLCVAVGTPLFFTLFAFLPDPDPNVQRKKEISALTYGITNAEKTIKENRAKLILLENLNNGDYYEKKRENEIEVTKAVIEALVAHREKMKDELRSLQEEENERLRLLNQANDTQAKELNRPEIDAPAKVRIINIVDES